MSQATITADVIGSNPGQAVTANRRRQLGIVLASALVGAALALAVNAGVNIYQANVAAQQAALVNAAQLDAQRSLFLASERQAAPAAGVTDNDRAIAAHLKSERNESTVWSVPQSGVPAFMQSERDETPSTHGQLNLSHWTVPQSGVPAFMQSERDETPAGH